MINCLIFFYDNFFKKLTAIVMIIFNSLQLQYTCNFNTNLIKWVCAYFNVSFLTNERSFIFLFIFLAFSYFLL
jgi:hypothetical protein